MLALAAVIPVSGWAARRYGAKQVYLVSLVLFTLGSAACGLSQTTTQLIVFRILQGVGGGMIMPVGQMMMAEAAGPKRMGRVMSLTAIPTMLAPILGPTLGGLIIDYASWRWIFEVNVPVGIIAVIAGWRILPKGHRMETDKLDVVGLGLMAGGLILLTYGLAQIGELGTFDSTKVLVPGIVGIAMIGGFILHALRVKNPLLDLFLYRRADLRVRVLRDVLPRRGAVRLDDPVPALLAGDPPLQRRADRPADRAPGDWGGVGDAHRGTLGGPLRRRPDRTLRRVPDDARLGPARADRRRHVRRVAVHHHAHPWHGHRPGVPARHDGRVRRTGPLRAVPRDATAERADAGRRLHRHRDPRGGAAARGRRRDHAR